MSMVFRPSASLYVGNLHPDVTEAVLYEVFSQVGTVASLRICRDSMTRRSLGYGYVNYINLSDADRALDALNYTPIKGKPVRIMWSQRDPALRKSGLGNIFIKNLDKSIDNKTLHDTFSSFGNILSCKVMTDENGNSRGFGFVHFESSDAAAAAITKVNGLLLNEKIVYVGQHVSRRERTSKAEELRKNFTNIFAKNLDENVSDEEFKEMFTPYGEITSAIVMRDESGKSKGFGFVNFKTHDEASNACDETNEKEIGGKKLFVGRAQKKSERKEELTKKFEALKQERLNKYQGVNLYVKNLDDTITDDKLRSEFAQYGTITSAKVQTDDKGISKGFGFVCFSSRDEATRAVNEMNGKLLGSKPLYVALAQRKEERKQLLETQYNNGVPRGVGMQQPYPYPPFFPYSPVPRGQQFMGYNPSGMVRPNRFPPQAEMMGGFPQSGIQPSGVPGGRPPVRQGGARPRAPTTQRGAPNGAGPSQTNVSSQPRNNKAGYKYTSNARNRVDNNATTHDVSQNQHQASQHQSQHSSILQDLRGATDASQQKQMLGEALYMNIASTRPDQAAKITGMLLEMDISELINLIESPEHLNSKVEEAIAVLDAHNATEH